MKKFISNEPLMYITQPKSEKPQSYMQSEFTSAQMQVQQHKKQENKPKDDTAMTSFNHLSLEEKINYLVNIPSGLFQMKCKFTTKEKTYYGTVLKRDKETVDIIHSGRQKVTINIQDFEAINLIGL